MVPLILAFVAYRSYIFQNHAIELLRSQMFIGKMLSSIISVYSHRECTVIFIKGAVQLRNDLLLKIIQYKKIRSKKRLH